MATITSIRNASQNLEVISPASILGKNHEIEKLVGVSKITFELDHDLMNLGDFEVQLKQS